MNQNPWWARFRPPVGFVHKARVIKDILPAVGEKDLAWERDVGSPWKTSHKTQRKKTKPKSEGAQEYSE